MVVSHFQHCPHGFSPISFITQAKAGGKNGGISVNLKCSIKRGDDCSNGSFIKVYGRSYLLIQE